MDVDPKLQTNRVADLGRTVRPSSRAAGVALLVALAVMSVFGAICAASGHGFDIFALLYILSGQWEFTGAQWALAGLLVILAGALAGLCWWLLARKVAPKVTGSADRTRVDVYAPSMGHGEAVSKVTRERAEKMASRLAKDYDPKRMEPGYPLGRGIVDGTPMSTSWEDVAIVLAGPRSGKSLCYAIPAVCSAPGPCLATSNKGDILDVTRPVRMHDHPDGRIWVFDPERIAEPNRKHTTWVWNLIDSIHTIADAKRIADCWRHASGQPQTGGDDFFPGTAAQQLADYLFAAHLGGKTVADVFRWASSERNTEPVTILTKHEGYGEIAARVSSVIALTPETRSGVFGSLQTMVAFLADPDVIEWVLPREGDGTPEGRDVFDPLAFATSEGDTLYLLSAQGRPSTALTASLTAVVAFTAFQYAQSECADNNRRLPRPMCCVLDEAANICRWPELADVYSYFGSAGIPIMTIWQNPDQGKAAFGETNFGSLQTMVAVLADPEIIDWIDPHRDAEGNIDERRGLFDPYEFATSEDTLYLLSAQGRPSTALTASLTAVVAFTAFQRAQSEFTGNNRRLPVPLCCVLDEAANICRWPELADVYSYFGSAGIPIMTIWQNPDQGRAAFGETNFGSLFNNANITVYLGGIKDAKFLGEISQLVGQREIVRGSVNIDGNGRRSVNNSIQKENILDVSDLTEWPVGRALLLASQSRAQIVKTLPWTGNRQWADALAQAKAKAREEQRKAA